MEKNLEKSLKRYLKRKVKITMGFVVAFMITGSIGFAEVLPETITGKDPFILNSGEKYIKQDNLNMKFEDNKYVQGIFIGPNSANEFSTIKGKIETSDNLNISVNHYDAMGIWIRNGGELDINSKNIVINSLTEEVEKGSSYSIAKGIYLDNRMGPNNKGKGGKLNITADTVNITAKATHENAWAYGIHCITRSTALGKDDVSRLIINAKDTNITAVTVTKGASNGIIAWSQGEVLINNGNVAITADNIINTRGNSLVELNKSNNSQNTVKLDGDIVFEYSDSSKTTIDSDVIINLANKDSSFKGKIYIESDVEQIPPEKSKVNNMTLNLSNGATWIMEGDSFVNNSELKGGVIDVGIGAKTLKVFNDNGIKMLGVSGGYNSILKGDLKLVAVNNDGKDTLATKTLEIANKGNILELGENSSITGNIFVNSNAELTNNGTLKVIGTLENNGIINLSKGTTINLAENSSFKNEKGATLNVESGATAVTGGKTINSGTISLKDTDNSDNTVSKLLSGGEFTNKGTIALSDRTEKMTEKEWDTLLGTLVTEKGAFTNTGMVVNKAGNSIFSGGTAIEGNTTTGELVENGAAGSGSIKIEADKDLTISGTKTESGAEAVLKDLSVNVEGNLTLAGNTTADATTGVLIENVVMNISSGKSVTVTGQDNKLSGEIILNGESKLAVSDNADVTLSGKVSQGETVENKTSAIELTNGTLNLVDANVNVGIKGTGQDTISVNNSTVNGNISLSGGNLNLADTAKINGDINFNNENGKIVIGENFSEDNFTGDLTGNVAKGILGIDYQINSDVTALNKHLQIFDGIKIVQLKDGADNNINLSDITSNHFSEIRGGTGNDSFAVSVDKFEKLSSIDGGANGTAGDTLKIDGFGNVSNIGEIVGDTTDGKEDGIDDTFFNKIQNIENLEFGSFTDAQLNLNNLTSEYLKNLNIKLGGFTNEIYISTNNLKELKGLTGKGITALKITNAVTDRNDTFDFLAKGDGINGVNSIKKVHFSENDDTINLNNLNTANSEITKIYGDAGNDTFIASLETLGKIEQLDGGKGGERNSLEITDTLILNNETNPDIFENVHDIEKLVLSGTGNNIVIDNLVSDDPTKTFTEVTGTNGGEKGNTFIINGTDESKKDKVLGMKIDGGTSSNDILKIDTENITLNDKYDTLEKILINKTGIENLVLGNADNTIDFNYTDGDKTLEDFKNIIGGTGKDIFKVSADKLVTLDRLDGGTYQIDNDTNDILEITNGNILDSSVFGKVQNIEELTLADNSSNNIDLDNLTFKNITAQNGEDTFKVSADKLGNFTVTGGTGNDTLEVKTAFSNGESLKNYKNIETLKLNESGNIFALNKENADGDNFKNINFGTSSIGNTITLANDLGAKNITFETLDETNKVSVDSTADVNGVKTFEHTITNAGKITLASGNSEWKFGEKSLITGNTTVDFGNNSLNFVENKNTIDFDNINETAKLNTGNLGLNTDGTLSMGDLSFVENNSRITVENAEIKIGFNETVKFAEGVNTKPFTITEGKEIVFGTGVTFTSPYNFIKINGKEISVKQWNEYKGYNSDLSLYAGRYDSILKKYNGTDKESIAVTNALNGFSEENIFDFVISKGTKLVYYSDEDGTPYNTEVTGEDILIKTNPDTAKDQDMNLTFNNIVSSGNIKIEVTEGKDNTVTFGNVENDSESFVSVNSIDGSTSTKDLTLNFFGKTNNADKIVINNGNSNKINISGNTTIKEITLGDGADEIYLGENSQNVTIDKINFGAGDDTLNIGSTGTINLSEINLGAGNNEIYFKDISNVTAFNVVKSQGDNGTNEIKITETQDNSDKFNLILKGADKDVEKITVWEENKLEINNDFSGELLFSESRNNIINVETAYTGDIGFIRGENTVNISENGSIDGTKLSFAGSKNTLNVNGGTVTNGIKFEENSYGNKVTVSENGNIGKDIIFGSDYAGTEKENLDEFTIALKDNGIFDYNVTNADMINISGVKGEIKFGENASITSNSEITLNTNGGVIGFDINKNGNITSKNPFGNTSVKVNGDIKITLDSSVKFGSLSDTINLGLGNIKSDNIITSAFLDYKEGVISIKSADKLTGLNETSYGNYEHIILNYNNGKEYAEITEKLNTGSLSDIVSMLNSGITKGSYYFYSDQRTLGEEVENQIVLGDIFVKTSEDTNKTAKDTDVTFKNITGKTAELSFAENTKNSVSFLEGTVLNKIDGSGSNAGFTLNLGDVKFTAEDSETKVTMSNFNDILNINSAINGISVNAGKGDDTVNILSSIEGTLDGNDGENILNIGAETKTLSDKNSQDEITLNGEIKNFQNINLNQNTKFESSLKITGTNEIKLNGNSLFVDVDYSRKAEDKVIGHALYDNGIKVDNSIGKVMIDTAEAGDGTIISLGTAGNKTEFTSTDKEHLLESGSSNHHIEMIDGDIVIKVNEHIMGDSETGAIKYAHLDKIYQSIVSADKIKEMAETTTLSDKTKDEAVKAQLEFYGKIYHSTPYAYSNDISKKSADLITESIMNLKVMPEYNQWIFGGSIAGREADSDNNFYGKNLHKVDIGKNEISADTNIYGAYTFGKYGIGENKSVGFALAGTRSDTDISGNSKLEGDGIYVSAFAEQEMNNLKFLAGISYQHSFYDSTRNVSNDYQRMSVDKKYEDDLVSIFAGGKYSYHLGNNFFAEPNIKLSVTHIMQDKINEGDNGLTIETDKKDFTFVEGEVGIDLVKKVNLSKGTLNLRAGTSLVYLLDGYQEEYLTGRITGSSKDFEMISPEDDRAKVKITVGTEYEMTNGMFMNLYGNYTTSSHTEDYAVSFGAGYKF